MSKTIFSIDNQRITLSKIDSLTKQSHAVKASSEVLEQVEKCRKYLEEKLEASSEAIYGINTGFGILCDTKISDSELLELQENLIRSHACGMGKEVPEDIVRLIFLLKIKNLSLGHSGIRTSLLQRMVDLYNAGKLPVIYQQGSLGASGDLAPLAHLAVFLTEKQEGFEPFPLKEKEGIALLNGTQFSAAYGVATTLEAAKLWHLSTKIAALSAEVYACNHSPFNELTHKVRNHEGQLKTAQLINHCREGSSFTKLPIYSVQDPYSFRCIPQVHGASYATIRHCWDLLENEVNSVTDNPLIFPDEDEILSGGNFHAQPIAMAIDYLGLALSELSSISERRIYQLINGDRDLPKFLVGNAGLNSGFMIAQYTAASIVSQSKQWTMPASSDSIVSCKGQEDHVSMAANAATKAYEILQNTKRVLAIELVCAVQAYHLRKLETSPILEELVQRVQRQIPYLEKDRFLSTDLQQAERIINAILQETEVSEVF